MRENIAFYPFTEKQLLIAGEPGVVDKNNSYQQLVNFFTQNYAKNKEEVDSIVEECVYATRIGDGLNDVLSYFFPIY
jgi:hypothetical protein